MDIYKCKRCGCRWTKASPMPGYENVWVPFNDKQRPYQCCCDDANYELIEHLDPALYPCRKWNLDDAWHGQTAALIGHAYGLTEASIDALPRDTRKVAINQAVQLVPDADMFVALDPHHPFWERVKDFKGIKVLGVPAQVGTTYDLRAHDPLYAGMMYEWVDYAPHHTIEIRNNALAALRLVERMGVARVILLGLDAEAYDAKHAHTGFYGFKQGLAKVRNALTSRGIVVEDGEWKL